MHISPQVIGSIAGIIALASVIPYIASILKGHTKPSRAAYAIWLIIDLITATSYIAAGARSTIWVSVVLAASAFIIFCLSIKYGMGGSSKLDLFCLALAAIAITLWVTTNDPVTALYTSLIAGKIGYLPVVKKSYLQPETENTSSWVMVAVASVLNVFALTSLNLEIALLPITSAIVQLLIVGLLVMPRRGSLVKSAS
jgi:hypothetical protein